MSIISSTTTTRRIHTAARRSLVAVIFFASLLIVTASTTFAAGGKHYLKCMNIPIAPCAAARVNPFWSVLPENNAFDRKDVGPYYTDSNNDTWVRLD